MHDREQLLDELLDRGLLSYSQTEPLAGLEERVLNRLAWPEPRAPWFGWRMSIAGAAAAIAIASWMVWPAPKTIAPPLAQNPVIRISPAPAISSGPAPVLTQPAATHTARAIEPVQIAQVIGDGLLRRDVFPAPQALSAEDRLLLSYLKQTPQEEILANSLPPELPLELRNELRLEPSLAPAKQEITNTK